MNKFLRDSFFVLLVAMLLSLLHRSAAAQGVSGFVENQARLSNNHQFSQIQVALDGTFTERLPIGWWVWVVANQDWAETFVGFSYMPTSWCTLQLGVGPEVGSDRPRYGANLWLGHGAWSVLTLTEWHGSGHWRRIEGKYDLGRWGLGAMHESSLGIGPRVEYRFDGKPGVVLWTATLVNSDSVATAYVGTRLAF